MCSRGISTLETVSEANIVKSGCQRKKKQLHAQLCYHLGQPLSLAGHWEGDMEGLSIPDQRVSD